MYFRLGLGLGLQNVERGPVGSSSSEVAIRCIFTCSQISNHSPSYLHSQVRDFLSRSITPTPSQCQSIQGAGRNLRLHRRLQKQNRTPQPWA